MLLDHGLRDGKQVFRPTISIWLYRCRGDNSATTSRLEAGIRLPVLALRHHAFRRTARSAVRDRDAGPEWRSPSPRVAQHAVGARPGEERSAAAAGEKALPPAPEALRAFECGNRGVDAPGLPRPEKPFRPAAMRGGERIKFKTLNCLVRRPRGTHARRRKTLKAGSAGGSPTGSSGRTGPARMSPAPAGFPARTRASGLMLRTRSVGFRLELTKRAFCSFVSRIALLFPGVARLTGAGGLTGRSDRLCVCTCCSIGRPPLAWFLFPRGFRVKAGAGFFYFNLCLFI
jgi:hypothetical protein